MAEAAGLDAHLRVAGAVARHRNAVLAQPLESVCEELGIAIVKRLQAIDCGRRVIEELRLERFGRGDGKDGV
ncbi:hypothetical protein D3C72_2147750 [compost metagenome]